MWYVVQAAACVVLSQELTECRRLPDLAESRPDGAAGSADLFCKSAACLLGDRKLPQSDRTPVRYLLRLAAASGLAGRTLLR